MDEVLHLQAILKDKSIGAEPNKSLAQERPIVFVIILILLLIIIIIISRLSTSFDPLNVL